MPQSHSANTREFVELLRREGELKEIPDAVDPHLELADIQRRVVARQGPALLFTNVKDCAFPVAANLYGSFKRIELAFGGYPAKLIGDAVRCVETSLPPTLGKIWEARRFVPDLLRFGARNIANAAVMAREISPVDVGRLPQVQCWPEDGGAFITLPLVHTENPLNGKSNLGMYRIQLYGGEECGMHIQIQRGGGFHYHAAEKLGRALPAHVYVGGPPALTLAAILPLPEDVPEVLFASLLAGKKIRQTLRADVSPLPILADADFCLVGGIPPGTRRPEGPFGDHYGYYSLKHDHPVFKVKRIFHRADAIYPVTIVGRPPQEDHYLACYLQDLLKPLIQLVMPRVKDIWAYEESGVHTLTGAVVKDRYPREAITTAFRILGEGQLSLTKVLMLTDRDGDVKDFRWLLTTVLERMDFARDLFVIANTSMDTLDYTGPKLHDGSKSVWLGLGDAKRGLPAEFSGALCDNRFSQVRVFSPGALVVSGPAWREQDGIADALAAEKALAGWPLVILADDARAVTSSSADFLWHVFTRFEPAGDIYARQRELKRYHVALTPPVVIDCRLKPWYPKVLEADPESAARAGAIVAKYLG